MLGASIFRFRLLPGREGRGFLQFGAGLRLAPLQAKDFRHCPTETAIHRLQRNEKPQERRLDDELDATRRCVPGRQQDVCNLQDWPGPETTGLAGVAIQ